MNRVQAATRALKVMEKNVQVAFDGVEMSVEDGENSKRHVTFTIPMMNDLDMMDRAMEVFETRSKFYKYFEDEGTGAGMVDGNSYREYFYIER